MNFSIFLYVASLNIFPTQCTKCSHCTKKRFQCVLRNSLLNDEKTKQNNNQKRNSLSLRVSHLTITNGNEETVYVLFVNKRSLILFFLCFFAVVPFKSHNRIIFHFILHDNDMRVNDSHVEIGQTWNKRWRGKKNVG